MVILKNNRSWGCIGRRRPLIQVLLVVSLTFSLFFLFEESFAYGAYGEYGEIEVRFKGVVTTDEEWGDFVAYGSYYCKVSIEEILYDPNNTLSLSDVVTVCYSEPLFLETEDEIECYGLNCINCSSCPKQFVGKIVCKGNSYYTIPEFSSFFILPLFMLSTLVLLIVYRRKHYIDRTHSF